MLSALIRCKAYIFPCKQVYRQKSLSYIWVSYRASACCLGKNNKNIFTQTETITTTPLLKQEEGRFFRFAEPVFLPADGITWRRKVVGFKWNGLGSLLTKSMSIEALRKSNGLIPPAGVFSVFVFIHPRTFATEPNSPTVLLRIQSKQVWILTSKTLFPPKIWWFRKKSLSLHQNSLERINDFLIWQQLQSTSPTTR